MEMTADLKVTELWESMLTMGSVYI